MDRTKVSRQKKQSDPMTEDVKQGIIMKICNKISQLIDMNIIKKSVNEVKPM